MERDEEGFSYPFVNEDICISCGKCIQVCPMHSVPEFNSKPRFFGVKLKSMQERMKSSSGGAFFALAKLCLKKQGAVCGAAYDEALRVHHVLAENAEKLESLRGTKYVQSDIEKAYADIHAALMGDRYVLFSGTPCQVAGLKNYLGKEYDILLCMDLICHGVPSAGIWQRYCQEMKPGQRVCAANMRSKEQGIRQITLDYHLEDGTCIREPKNQSLYMKGFIQNLYVRPSCFVCPFKGIKRCSDITIGDFWADREFYPAFADKYGTSSVIVHTKKGMNWLKQTADDVEMIAVKKHEILCWNNSVVDSAEENERRAAFWEKTEHMSVTEAIGECVIPVFPLPKPHARVDRMMNLIRRVCRRTINILRG